MKYRLFHAGLPLICPAALFLALCAPARFPVLHPVEKVDRTKSARAKAEEYFIRARDCERRGLELEARELYEMAFHLDPSSEVLREQVVRNYLEAGAPVQALALVKGNRRTKELRDDEKRIVASIYLKMGDFVRAAETMELIAVRREGDFYSLAVIYEALGDVSRAIERYRSYYGSTGDASLEIGLKIARMLLGQKQYAAADSFLASIEVRHGRQASVLALQGKAAEGRGDTASAFALYNRAISLDSSNNESLSAAAQVAMQRNDLPLAIALYDMLYRRCPPYQGVYGRTLAVLCYYDRQYGRAEELLKKLLATSFDDAELHYYLGLVFSSEKRYDLARIELEKSAALDSLSSEVWRELSLLSIKEKKFDLALADARRFTAAMPKAGAAWRMLGYVLSLRKEYGRAIEAFAKATGLDSTDLSAWFEIGSCYERNKDVGRAAVAFRKVLALKKNDPAAANYLGYMWAEKGMHLDSAQALLETALAQEGGNGAFLDSHAWIFFKKGDLLRAESFIRKALLRIRDDPVVLEHFGDILLVKGDCPAAKAAYGKSLECHTESEDSLRLKMIRCEPFVPGGSGR